MKLTSGVAYGALVLIVIITVLFQVYATVVPEAQDAGDEMNVSTRCTAQVNSAGTACFYNTTGTAGIECQWNSSNSTTACNAASPSIPLSGLFGATSIVFIIVMAFLLVMVVRGALKSK